MASKTASKETSFLIVGAGTFGLSTALHLTNRGYKNIVVLDRGDDVPSAFSAGNDVNKIVRADYEDPFYATHALKAIHAWRNSPIFSPHYHHSGYLVTSSASAPSKATSHVTRLITALSSHPDQPKSSVAVLHTPEDVQSTVPHLTGPLTGWSGYYNSNAGYAQAAPALKALYTELLARGVEFRLGDSGHAVSILPDTQTAKAFPAPRPYIRTADGKIHCADLVILALGAHTARLLSVAGAQLTAKAWAVGHVRVSAQEAAHLRGLPVVNCRDVGFFFEPVPAGDEHGQEWLIKVCAHGGGYTNRGRAATSLPPWQAEENKAIPVEDEMLMRRLLRETLPELAKRRLERRFMCWCADTADSEYVIDYVPGYRKGLVLAGGDSGHGFKMLPVFGGWVVDLVERGQQTEKRWRWKTGDSDGQEELGWRVGGVRDIREVQRMGDGAEATRPRL
ncbi:sarcosine oxidase [Massariosphaeria phaeospora]|uniref:Sarcosine oxidase n=1 Tax=Massariosphaeria phaeospora TaxID=100035 RepID=A0A7C8I679_9PLEO|nr:sarcosine oxidase [Massariosphaeria phaeospora]